jgi:thiosulfate reductase cytochrome b subunit
MGEIPQDRPGARLHPWPVRIMHWLNALAIIVMIGSGWKIYNDEEIFGWLRFPDWATLGGDPGLSVELRGNSGYSGALLWHFAGMWLLVLNGLAYLGYGFATGRFRERLLPLRPREVLREFGLALRLNLRHGDITMYNAVQKLLYVGVILAAAVQVMSGLAIWKPMQLWWLAALFGDFQTARLVHFIGMSAIVLFLLVHVALALLVPRTLLAMITGGPRVKGHRTPGAFLPGAGP